MLRDSVATSFAVAHFWDITWDDRSAASASSSLSRASAAAAAAALCRSMAAVLSLWHSCTACR